MLKINPNLQIADFSKYFCTNCKHYASGSGGRCQNVYHNETNINWINRIMISKTWAIYVCWEKKKEKKK